MPDPDEMAELERQAGFTQEVDERLSGGGRHYAGACWCQVYHGVNEAREQNVLPPSDKSPAMTEFLEGAFGRSSAIKTLTCTPKPMGCGRQIDPGEIENWPPATVREYQISGWCKTCQDEVFKEE